MIYDSDLRDETDDGVRLILDTARAVHEPSLLLQWCVKRETIEHLRELKVEDPHLFIVIVDDRGGEHREVVPLDQLRKLVYFYRPGLHEIHATIVWPTSDRMEIAQMRRELLKVSSYRDPMHRYENRVVNGTYDYDGTFRLDINWWSERPEYLEWRRSLPPPPEEVEPEEGEESEESGLALVEESEEEERDEVEFRFTRQLDSDAIRTGTYAKTFGYAKTFLQVADGYFAKEPSAWEKWWVNLWFGGEAAHDQCHFRRRRLVAYTLQPPLVALFIATTTTVRALIALFFSLFGRRGVDYAAIVHPFNNEIHDVYRNAESDKETSKSVFVYDTEGNKRPLGTLWWWFTPAVPLAIFLAMNILFLAQVLFSDEYVMSDFRNAVLPAAGFALSIPFLVTIMTAFVMAGGAFIGALVAMFSGVLEPLKAPSQDFFAGEWRRTRQVFGFIGRPFVRLANWWDTRSERKAQQKRDREEAEKRARREALAVRFAPDAFGRRFEHVVCDGVDTPKDVRKVPFSLRRTAVLRFEEMKYRVCKPFARR